MKINCILNGKAIQSDVSDDMMLLEFLRNHNCFSVKSGCETTNCGLCTVWIDHKPHLSCSVPVARVQGKSVTTLEGVEQRAIAFGTFLANEGSEQCGFCAPGFIMCVLAMEDELVNPSEDDIKSYLAGNLCRCSGYMGQLRAIKKYLDTKGKAL